MTISKIYRNDKNVPILKLVLCPHCYSIFDRCKDFLKVGTGMVQCIEGERNAGLFVEAVVIISESKDTSSPCYRAFGANTEVFILYALY